MDNWKFIFRMGIAPLLSHSSLVALKKGVQEDDPTLVQDCVVFPRSTPLAWELPACACGLFAYCGKEGEGLVTVFEVEQFHDRIALEADKNLGWPGAARVFLDWCDRTDRQALRRKLFHEIQRELRLRWRKARNTWNKTAETNS